MPSWGTDLVNKLISISITTQSLRHEEYFYILYKVQDLKRRSAHALIFERQND